MSFQQGRQVCGHCGQSHVGGKNVCVNRGVGGHANNSAPRCAACTRARVAVPAPAPVPQPARPNPVPVFVPPPASRPAHTPVSFRIVINVPQTTHAATPMRVVLDRAHSRIARQYLNYGLLTASSASITVDFGAVAAGMAGGMVLTEFTGSSISSRTYSTMREEGGVSSIPTRLEGATEDFSERPGRPSRHFDPAQRTSGGDSLVLWIASTFAGAVDVVVQLHAWGQHPTDPNLGRAIDYDPPVLAANAAGHVVQVDAMNPRFATIRLVAGGRGRVSGGNCQVNIATNWVTLMIDGVAATSANYPGLAQFLGSIHQSGLGNDVAVFLKIR